MKNKEGFDPLPVKVDVIRIPKKLKNSLILGSLVSLPLIFGGCVNATAENVVTGKVITVPNSHSSLEDCNKDVLAKKTYIESNEPKLAGKYRYIDCKES